MLKALSFIVNFRWNGQVFSMVRNVWFFPNMVMIRQHVVISISFQADNGDRLLAGCIDWSIKKKRKKTELENVKRNKDIYTQLHSEVWRFQSENTGLIILNSFLPDWIVNSPNFYYSTIIYCCDTCFGYIDYLLMTNYQGYLTNHSRPTSFSCKDHRITESGMCLLVITFCKKL